MNAQGANADSQYLKGNQIQNWVAPNITNDQRTGLGSWSAGDIVEYVRTGRNARSVASGPIAEVVQYSAAFMPDADLHAIAVYMKERVTADPAAPPPRSPPPTPRCARARASTRRLHGLPHPHRRGHRAHVPPPGRQ